MYIDDANLPSLLSLPVLGYMSTSDKVYQTTRSKILSAANPFYFEGSVADGIGGPHVGFNYTWPIAIAVRMMTADTDAEAA